jgi:hypothetical protein
MFVNFMTFVTVYVLGAVVVWLYRMLINKPKTKEESSRRIVSCLLFWWGWLAIYLVVLIYAILRALFGRRRHPDPYKLDQMHRRVIEWPSSSDG